MCCYIVYLFIISLFIIFSNLVKNIRIVTHINYALMRSNFGSRIYNISFSIFMPFHILHQSLTMFMIQAICLIFFCFTQQLQVYTAKSQSIKRIFEIMLKTLDTLLWQKYNTADQSTRGAQSAYVRNQSSQKRQESFLSVEI